MIENTIFESALTCDESRQSAENDHPKADNKATGPVSHINNATIHGRFTHYGRFIMKKELMRSALTIYIRSISE